MMRNIKYVFFIAFIFELLLLSGCEPKVDELTKDGAVTFVKEYNFWGIIGDDQKKYVPVNIPEKYCTEGKRVRFSFVFKDDAPSEQTWGRLIEIKDISSI